MSWGPFGIDSNRFSAVKLNAPLVSQKSDAGANNLESNSTASQNTVEGARSRLREAAFAWLTHFEGSPGRAGRSIVRRFTRSDPTLRR